MCNIGVNMKSKLTLVTFFMHISDLIVWHIISKSQKKQQQKNTVGQAVKSWRNEMIMVYSFTLQSFI